MTGVYLRSEALMGTVVTVEVPCSAGNYRKRLECEETVDRAMTWFRCVEETCSRFDPQSELRRLSAQTGVAVPVSAMLYRVIEFALKVAEETGGAFDPTVGGRMERRGFKREFRSGQSMGSAHVLDVEGSYRDIHLDPAERTVTLGQALVLDLGAVAKGLAVDLAAQELRRLTNFSIDAGGDLYLGGRNPSGRPWSVGIRHPREAAQVIDRIRVSDAAVCTSGDYERRCPDGGPGHHILDPREGTPASAVASVTVVSPSAMVADALATAAWVLGTVDGMQMLERHGVDGLIVTSDLERFATPGMKHE
jgi:thiamine biosynthesis lipoprotein